MEDPIHNTEEQHKPGSHLRVTLVLAAVVVLVIAASLWFLFKSPSPQQNTLQLVVTPRMTDSEKDYAKNLRVENIAMSRAENFLHQEVTVLNAEVVNAGPQAIAALELSVEFTDQMNQIVLREARSILGAPPAALAPGERRAFEISFDHVPTSWNMQSPAVRVTSLQLAKTK
ncbi:MAG TPA: hypothetical protein VGF61_04290 [Candidatus Acidoferrum sp.]|jgi:hypothetical protein